MAHLATYSAISSGSTTVTTPSFTVPATATYCTVITGMRGADGTATTLSSAAVGAQAVTLNSSIYRVFETFQSSEGGYILSADMPSGSVTATATRGTATNGFSISVSFFDDADQSAPAVALASNGAGGDPFNTPITMAAAGVLVDGITTSNTGATFITNQTGQTERSHDSPSGSLNSYSSTRAVSSGSQTMGWDTGGNGDRTTHLIFGIEAGATGASITPSTTTPLDGALLTITPAGMTGPITAATMSGLDILSLLSSTDPSSPITFTVDVSSIEVSASMPRIGQLSTISFTTATDGAVTTDVTLQPKADWTVVDLAATLIKTTTDGVKSILLAADDDLGITTAIGNQLYYQTDKGESITAQGLGTYGTIVPYEFMEFVIQQGGSATTVATSYPGAFYPFGTGSGGGVPKTKFRRFPWQPYNKI